MLRSERLAQTANGARLTIPAIWLFTNAWRRTANCYSKVRIFRGVSNLTQSSMTHGDFTALAGDYARYRPSYSTSVATAILALVGRPPMEIDAADVGAGTGI